MTHWYRAFGLTIESEFPLPELCQCAASADTDVRISRGRVTVLREDHYFEADRNEAKLWAPEAATAYQMLGGAEIWVDCESRHTGPDSRLFLLGSAFAAILHQRRLLPLHACAVEIGGRSWAFLGRSGAGKSTLAAWLVDHGARLLSDDVCVTNQCGAGFVAVRGIPRLRLWREVLEMKGLDMADYERSHALIDKYDVPTHRLASDQPIPLAGLFLLESSDTTAFTPLAGSEAVEALSANTYRGSFLRKMGLAADHFEQCIALARRVSLSRFERPLDLSRLDETGSALLRAIDQAA